MNKLRAELQSLLSETECIRPAALRRSLREDFLYATDLPQAAGRDAVRGFSSRARRAGWHTEEEDGWIQLEKPGAEPGDTGFGGPFGIEALACGNLLRRHPENRKDAGREKRLLVKAGEESPEAFEKACAILHREWAAALRQGEALPDLPEQIFTGGKGRK